MTVNMTNLTAADSFYDLANFASDFSGGYLWGMLLIALFVIMVGRLQARSGFERGVASASFLCLLFSLPLLYLGWISIFYSIIFAMVLAGTLMYIRFSES